MSAHKYKSSFCVPTKCVSCLHSSLLLDRNALCGKLQCENVQDMPVFGIVPAIIQTPSRGTKCWGVDFQLGSDVPDPGMVNEGTKCDAGKVTYALYSQAKATLKIITWSWWLASSLWKKKSVLCIFRNSKATEKKFGDNSSCDACISSEKSSDVFHAAVHCTCLCLWVCCPCLARLLLLGNVGDFHNGSSDSWICGCLFVLLGQ